MTDDAAQLQALRSLRERIAALSQTLSERELTGRLLRLEIEAELRTAGKTKTEAETLAKAAPRYLEHARLTIQREYDRDVALAEAESLRLQLELTIAERLNEVI